MVSKEEKKTSSVEEEIEGRERAFAKGSSWEF